VGDKEASICSEALEDSSMEGEVRRATAGGKVKLALCSHWTGIGALPHIFLQPGQFQNDLMRAALKSLDFQNSLVQLISQSIPDVLVDAARVCPR